MLAILVDFFFPQSFYFQCFIFFCFQFERCHSLPKGSHFASWNMVLQSPSSDAAHPVDRCHVIDGALNLNTAYLNG